MSGPGTELRAIIPKFFAKKRCGCRLYAAKMDRAGVEACERRFDKIVAYLCKQARRRRLMKWLGPVNEIVARKWVRLAIDRAREKESQIER